MIDWVTAEFACNNSLRTGCIAKIKPNDEVEWVSQSFMPVQGSHDATVVIKPLSEARVVVSGNPAKFLQGHNLFGSNDLKTLMAEFFSILYEILADDGLNFTIEQYDDVMNGNYTVSRVDINESFSLGNKAEVLAWIRAAGEKAYMTHRGKGVFAGDTLYFGKGSKHWFLKCYSKGDEINRKKSNFPKHMRTPLMLDYADKALRLELVLRSRFLRDTMLNNVCNWQPDTATIIFNEYVSRLEMSGNFMLDDETLRNMPSKAKGYYLLWKHGEDLRKLMSKNTFYRYRRFFKQYGIDIALIQDKDEQQQHIQPLIKILEAKPMGIPDWAYEQGLVFVG